MDIQLTANAGLIVTFRNGRRVLIDALHCKRTRFSPVSPEMIEHVMEIPADIMLFTHLHNDHCDEQLAVRYLQQHQDTKLVSIMPVMGIHPGRHVPLPADAGSVMVGDIEVEYVYLQHAGEKYRDFLNVGFAVRSDGESIAVLGDAETGEVHRGLETFMLEEPLQVAAVNFPIIATRKGTEQIEGVEVKHLVGIHLPFAQDDLEGYRRSAERAAPRTARKLGIPVTLLLEEGQQVHVD